MKKLHFKSRKAYHKFLAFEHMNKLGRKGKQKPLVFIHGILHKVKHGK